LLFLYLLILFVCQLFIRYYLFGTINCPPPPPYQQQRQRWLVLAVAAVGLVAAHLDDDGQPTADVVGVAAAPLLGAWGAAAAVSTKIFLLF
jgi:hypothetical protein